jgi:hypothetical protein
MKTPSSTVKLPVDLITKLKTLRRPHQSIAGVIEELIISGKGLSLSSRTLERLGYMGDGSIEEQIVMALDEIDKRVKELERK